MRGLLLTLGFLAVATATKNTNCTEGLYMIVARGSDEPAAASKSGLFPANSGSPGYLAQLIAAQIKGSKIMGVEYPATLNNYIPSENEGADVMLQLANDYHSSCPGSKMALLGYSQGAQVASDVLCGGAGGQFNHNAPLSPDIVKNSVIAAVLFGDPTHIANTTYDRGTSVHNGILARTNNTVCREYSDRMASWCDKGDEFCDAGHVDGVHDLYLQRYNATMVQYVVKRWQKSTVSSVTTTAASTGSSTNSGTSGVSTSTQTASPTTSESSRPSTGTASGLTILGWPLILLFCGILFV
ncbi:unnamed protein product [Penicillium discolor]